MSINSENDFDHGMPYCEACRSYHVTPRNAVHHAELQCKAEFANVDQQRSVAHTPGPWTYASGGNIMASAHHGFTVASVETFTGRSVCPEHERQANALLIAAAPDLLEAAEYCVSFLSAEHYPELTLRKRLLAAIAKAKGGA